MWPAYYRNGRHAHRELVTVTPTAGGLSIQRENGATFYWNYGEARKRPAKVSGESVLRLERHGGDHVETLTIESGDALEEIRRYAPEFVRPPVSHRMLPYLAGFALLACLPLAYGIVIPRAIAFATGFVPPELERQVGEKVAEGDVPVDQVCTGDTLYNTVQEIMDIVNPGNSDQRFHPRPIISSDVRFFSSALPGGYILIYHGLIAATASPEELAGVLAHEISHSNAGDARRIVFSRLAFPGLLAITTGIGREQVGRLATEVGTFSFSPDDEENADAAAVRMLLAAHVNPAPMVHLFEALENRPDYKLGSQVWTTVHHRAPGSGGRLRALAARANFQWRALPPFDDGQTRTDKEKSDAWTLATLGCYAKGK